jgi:hypothetical protein
VRPEHALHHSGVPLGTHDQGLEDRDHYLLELLDALLKLCDPLIIVDWENSTDDAPAGSRGLARARQP